MGVGAAVEGILVAPKVDVVCCVWVELVGL